MRMKLVGFLVLMLLGAGRSGAGELAANAPQDWVVRAQGPEGLADYRRAIAALIVEAQKTYPAVRQRYLEGLKAGNNPLVGTFYVKTELKDPDGLRVEQVFVLVGKIDVEKRIVVGRIANPLTAVRTFRHGQTISFPEAEVIDWTISKPDGSEDGNYIGKYMDALRDKAEAARSPKGTQ
jgi:hypothetical protein